MLKIGIIGCGGMGLTHASAYKILEKNVKVVAVADLLPEAAAKAVELVGAERVYATGMELLENEKLDYVDICLPTYLHTEHAVCAMEKGMNVFLEKPVCMNEDEAQLLLATQEKTGAIVQIGLCCRFNDGHDYLKKVIADGTYGKVIAGTFQRVSPRPTWGWDNWYMNPDKSGTVALDLHVHNADFIRYIMGEPDSFEISATRRSEGNIEHVYVTYHYGDAVIFCEDGWDFPSSFPFSESFRVKLEKATIVLNHEGFHIYTDDGETITPEFEAECAAELDVGINVSTLGEYFNELKYFTETLIAGKRPDRAPLIDGINAVRLVWREIEAAGGKHI